MLEQTYISGSTAVKIAESVETAIASGKAARGSMLPPIREAAGYLEVSPATVAAAYQLLRVRGVVESEGRRGTRIRHAPPVAARFSGAIDDAVVDLSDGNPDPQLLPNLTATLRRIDGTPQLYRDEVNLPRLVDLARDHFADDKVDARNLTIVSGALDGMERVLREHLRPGDRVAVEDPCFTGVVDLLSALALKAVPFGVDDEGPLPDELDAAVSPTTKALIITPRAQNPTGAAVSRTRQRELRRLLAGRDDLLVIEDDHAGAVAGAPFRSLVDSSRAKWAIVRSVSKSLGPDLRVAFLAGDAMTVARVEGRQMLGIRWVSHLLQQTVAELLSDRRIRSSLQHAEDEYAKRRRALIDALAAHGIRAHGESGLNVWIPLPEEAAVVSALSAAGYAVAAGERYRLKTPPAIRVTTARLAAAEARRFAATLSRIVRGGTTPRV